MHMKTNYYFLCPLSVGIYYYFAFASQVLVMTPQILLDALRKGSVSMDIICMLILDECHRTTGNHPYAKIMKVRITCYYWVICILLDLLFINI